MSWSDARDYVSWLSKKSGKRYRLANESEWEYAARVGTKTSRYWDDQLASACSNANVHDRRSRSVNNFSWSEHECDDWHAQTAPVGSYERIALDCMTFWETHGRGPRIAGTRVTWAHLVTALRGRLGTVAAVFRVAGPGSAGPGSSVRLADRWLPAGTTLSVSVLPGRLSIRRA